MKMLQRTVRERVEFSGVALHSGAEVSVVIKPAPEDTGILFTRADLPKKPSIHATWKNVVDTQMSTVLGNRRTRIATVEHLMSALRGLNIDNAFVEVYGPEVPILDGSSVSYIDALEAVGVIEQTKPVKYLQVLKPISVSIDDRFVYLLPASDLKISCRVNYKHPVVGLQHFEYRHNTFNYIAEVAKAKTFGFLNEVEKLKEKGLALGGSYKNALVLGSDNVINKDIMSYSDEFVRHKVLDIMGDMALCGNGTRLLAHIVAYKSGHELHKLALKELRQRKTCFKVLEEPVLVDEKAYTEKAFSLLQTVATF